MKGDSTTVIPSDSSTSTTSIASTSSSSLGISAASSNSSSDTLSTSSGSFLSSTSTHHCSHAHLEKDWCPGTKRLREIARHVAVKKESAKYSEEIGKEIVKRMKGVHFFRSYKSMCKEDDDSDESDCDSDSDDESLCCDFNKKGEHGFGCYTEDDEVDAEDHEDVEKIHKRDLVEAIRPFYEGECYLIKEDICERDVYFKHPNHPGTQAFVRASQHLVCRSNGEREYSERIFRRMRKLLYCSRFFVGKAPDCNEANEEELDKMFRARYEFDQKMMKKIIQDENQPRPIPGTVWLSCLNKKYDEDKRFFLVTLFQCLPLVLAIPILCVLGLLAFGLLYFLIWYVFKVIITTIYVVMGVSISYLIINDNDDDSGLTEGEAVKEAVDEYLEDTIGEVTNAAERYFRYLRG